MRYEPLSREAVRSVVEGRGAATRIPVLLHFWTHVETFEDPAGAERVRRVLEAYPEDAQVTSFRMPQMYRGGEDLPEYSWVPFEEPASEGPRGLDAQAALPEWDRFDEVLAQFPDPHQPGALADAPMSDGRYRLAHWWYWLFERHWSLRGMENALMDYHNHPAEVHRLYRTLTDFYKVLVERARHELGADGIMTSDDLGTQTGPFFSPAMFDEFFAPYYRELIEHTHALGMHVWLHACGNIEPILERLIDLGVDVLHPVQKYAMDEVDIVRRYGGRMTFWAGFDVQRIIPFGSPEDVRREVRHLMDTYARADGRFLFTAGNAIHGDCPPASLEALYEETFTYGSRPELRSGS